MTTQYRITTCPTRDGWRYTVQMRRGVGKPWADVPPYRSFTTRQAAQMHMEAIS